MSLDDLYALLLNHEMRIQQKRGKTSFNVLHNLSTNFAQKNQGLSKTGFGTQRSDRTLDHFIGDMSNSCFSSSSNGNHDSIIRQICFIPKHGAHKCKNRFNPAFVPQKYYGRGFAPYGAGRGFVSTSFIGFNRGFNG